MKYNILGSTGLKVSEMGIGLAALGRPGYINLGHADDLEMDYDIIAMQTRAHEVLNAAYDLGVRYFDAARSYGRAEQFLGSWLLRNKISAPEVTVGSKWGYTYTADWQVDAEHHEIKEHSLPVLKRQWQESQTHLGAHLKLYQIHSATIESGVLANKDVLAELGKIKSQGIAIGLSLSGAKQAETLKQALKVQIDGKSLFDCVQATWNLLEPSAGEILRDAHDAGLGIIIKEGLANGRLTDRNNESDFISKKAKLKGLAKELNTTIDALALAAILSQEWVDVVLSGAATITHLKSNLAAKKLNLTDEIVVELSSMVESPAEYWEKRSQLAWN